MWVSLRVEVHTNDTRADAAERIRAEVLRALEQRFGGVTVEKVREGGWTPPRYPAGSLERSP